MTNNLFDDELPEDNVELEIGVNIEKIQKNISDYSSEKLCEMIICGRYLHFSEELSVICMEELSKRREAGNTFNFENYIEKGQKELPILDFSEFNIFNVLTKAIGKKK